MNALLVSKGKTLNKNMTNTDSLNLTGLECTSASNTTCTSHEIKTNQLSCTVLDMPITIPGTVFVETTYYGTATQPLRIWDGLHWYQVLLTQVPQIITQKKYFMYFILFGTLFLKCQQ